MKTLQPYLLFKGDCREALDFYTQCLDGEIVMLQTYGESPLDVPDASHDRVFNSAFRAGELGFMASDCLPDQALEAGSNFALFVTFSEADEQARVFEALSDQGSVMMPLQDGFGMVMDRFDVRWMLALQSHE